MDKNNSKTMYDRSILTKVVWMYYIEGMTQTTIAEKIGVNRLKVIKMLSEAREQNLIQFNIPVLDREKIELEQKLINKFNLKDVFIVHADDEENVNETIAMACAMYINDLIDDDAYINMGYGDTLGKVLNNLAKISENKISIISMTGGVAPYLPNNTSHIFNAKLYLLPSPLIMSSAQTAKSILLEKPVKDIIEMTNLANISVVGIGDVSSKATIVKTNILSMTDIAKLQMKGAVGDVLMHFIDKDGNLVESEIEEKLVGISLEKVKSFQNVIGVAAGNNKIKAILATLKGGYINTLITDFNTAKQLFEEG